MKKTILLSAITCIVLSFAAAAQEEVAQESVQARTPAPGVAEERLTIEMKEKAGPATKGLKLEKEYRPRLPNGFGPAGVSVNTAQRDQIYKILTEYNEVIALLEHRIELLKNERDVKIDAVLTPAQQQRLNRPVRTLLPRVLQR